MSDVEFNSHEVVNLSQQLHKLLTCLDGSELEFSIVEQLNGLQTQLRSVVSQLEIATYFNRPTRLLEVDYLSEHGWGD